MTRQFQEQDGGHGFGSVTVGKTFGEGMAF